MSAKKLIVVGFLLLSWVLLTGIFVYSKSNITVISKAEINNVLTSAKFSEILKGERIIGKFNASENYLGQISVRFYNFDRINKDEVHFRLFEKSNLIYEHIYKTDQFLPNELFPFGFPLIADSRGKEYVFEIESTAGRSEDAVTLSPQEPLVSTSYQYPKVLLIKNPKTLSEFLLKKISYMQFNRDFAFSLIEYFVSLTISLFLIHLLLEKLFDLKKLRKIKPSSIVVGPGLVLVSFSAILLYLKQESLSEAFSMWGFFLLALGVIVLFLEIKLKLRK